MARFALVAGVCLLLAACVASAQKRLEKDLDARLGKPAEVLSHYEVPMEHAFDPAGGVHYVWRLAAVSQATEGGRVATYVWRVRPEGIGTTVEDVVRVTIGPGGLVRGYEFVASP